MRPSTGPIVSNATALERYVAYNIISCSRPITATVTIKRQQGADNYLSHLLWEVRTMNNVNSEWPRSRDGSQEVVFKQGIIIFLLYDKSLKKKKKRSCSRVLYNTVY